MVSRTFLKLSGSTTPQFNHPFRTPYFILYTYNMKQIYITRKIPDIGIKMMQDKGYSVDFYPKDCVPSQKEIIKALSKKPYDAVISLLTDKIDAKVFDAAPSAKIFSNYAIGFDNIDLAEANKRGILVTNTPGDYSECVAEHAIAMMLALATRMASPMSPSSWVRFGKPVSASKLAK